MPGQQLHKLWADRSGGHERYQFFQHRTFEQHPVSISCACLQCSRKLGLLEHRPGPNAEPLSITWKQGAASPPLASSIAVTMPQAHEVSTTSRVAGGSAITQAAVL